MDTTELIVSFLRPGIPILITALILRAARKPPEKIHKGALLLKYPKVVLYTGIFMFLGVTAIMIWSFTLEREPEYWAMSFMTLIGYGSGLLFMLIGLNFRIHIEYDGIKKVSMFGTEKKIKFSEIEKVEMGRVSRELSIQSRDKKIKAHEWLIGFNELVNSLEQNLNMSREKMGF